MNTQMLLGCLGGHELILIAVIVLLMVGVSRLMDLERFPSRVEGRGPHQASSRAYVDRLPSPERSRVSAHALPSEGPEPDLAPARV